MRTLLFGIFFLVALQPGAQEVVRTNVKTTARKLTEKTIVRDSAGAVYPYAIWSQLMTKGYILKAVEPADEASEMLLVKLSEKEWENRVSRLPPPRESKYFKRGQELSLFKTEDIRGEKINLKEARGKIIVLNFWFIACPPCRQEIPELNSLVEKFKANEDVLFVSIALDKKGDLEDFLQKSPFNYKVIDNGRFLADKYGVRSYPTHVIIDTRGKVEFHTSGLAMQTVYWLDKTISRLVAEGFMVKN
jgi:peroxiredoxin